MSDTPRTEKAMIWDDFLNGFTVPAEVSQELERELAETNHHRAVFEALWTGAGEVACGDPAQRILELRKELADLSRPAKLANPLYDVLDEMEKSMSQRIRDLANYMRNRLDHKNRDAAMIAFRDDLECYDRKIAPKPCQRCGGCFMLPGEGPDDDVMNTPCPDCNPQPPTPHSEDCPNCENAGWYMVPDSEGQPTMEQCQWCYTVTNSRFNSLPNASAMASADTQTPTTPTNDR